MEEKKGMLLKYSYYIFVIFEIIDSVVKSPLLKTERYERLKDMKMSQNYFENTCNIMYCMCNEVDIDNMSYYILYLKRILD